MNAKKKVVISHKNCTPEVLQLIKEKYPLGYNDYVIKVTKPNQDFFYAITVETADTDYLIKVDVKIDNLTEEEFDKEFGHSGNNGDDSSFESDSDAVESMESEDSGFED